MKYYFIVDNNVQWFSKIVAIGENEQTTEIRDIPSDIEGEMLSNIFDRELHFHNKRINGDTYYGWTISTTEFNKIKRLVELRSGVEEYHKILNQV